MTLGVALVVIVILFFLVKSEGFRKAALIFVALGALGCLMVYLYFQNENGEYKRKLAHAKTVITMDEIAILEPQVWVPEILARQFRKFWHGLHLPARSLAG
jgi:hypothetical protein